MPEVPKTRLETDLVPSDERYADAFRGLPLQATLNMLDAYQPAGNMPAEKLSRHAMEAVRRELLVSGQASRGESVDLSNVTDEALQQASEYLWDHAGPKMIARYRAFGENIIPITRRHSA